MNIKLFLKLNKNNFLFSRNIHFRAHNYLDQEEFLFSKCLTIKPICIPPDKFGYLRLVIMILGRFNLVCVDIVILYGKLGLTIYFNAKLIYFHSSIFINLIIRLFKY